jgi:hypothetical protein
MFFIIGGVIALANYRSQNRQRAIDNSFNSLNLFEKSIPDEDIEIWKKVYFNSHESVGAQPGHFVVLFEENKMQQVPISSLFIQEGTGLYLSEAKFGQTDSATDLHLGAIRRIAEQLNLIGCELLYGNVELRIIYYEIGQIMDCIYKWIDQIKDETEKEFIRSDYPYFMKTYRRHRRLINTLPRRSYVNFD